MTAPASLRALQAIRRFLSRGAAVMAYAAGWNYVLCAVFITTDVVGRAAFGVSSAATVEITGYMLAVGIAWGLAHALACRAHIRVDVWVNRLPLRLRAWLHAVALLLLGSFAGFAAWAGTQLVDESLLFDAHDNSALRVPLVLPQGLWAFGLYAFCAIILALSAEAIVALLLNRPDEVDRLLGPRTIDDEAAEALEAVGMARRDAA